MFCGKCGAQVPDGFEFCMKCGTKIDTSQVVSTEGASAVKAKPKKKKVLISLAVAIMVVLATVVAIFGMKDTAEENSFDDKNGYFADIPWGTDIETVQKKVEEAFKCKTSIGEENDSVIASIENYDGMQGVGAVPILSCEDNGTLNKVAIAFTAGDDSEYSGEQIAEELLEKYNELFGKADSSMGFTYKWSTPNSSIELVYFSEDLIMLNYEK